MSEGEGAPDGAGGSAGTVTTRLCEVPDVDHPIVQAPVGSGTTPELAAAVSEAGALGTLAVTWRDLEATADAIAATAEHTDRPFGVNLVLEDDAGEAITRYDEALATRDVKGRADGMALFAGQSAGMVGDVRPAGVVVGALVAETGRALDRLERLRGG